MRKFVDFVIFKAGIDNNSALRTLTIQLLNHIHRHISVCICVQIGRSLRIKLFGSKFSSGNKYRSKRLDTDRVGNCRDSHRWLDCQIRIYQSNCRLTNAIGFYDCSTAIPKGERIPFCIVQVQVNHTRDVNFILVS